MALRDLFQRIESDSFAIEANLASGQKLYSRILASESAVQELILAVRDPKAAISVLRQVLRLARIRVDVRYQNPFDTALAAYIHILNTARPELTKLAAGRVLNAQNCWWAARLARTTLFDTVSQTNSKVETAGTPSEPRFSADASDTVVIMGLEPELEAVQLVATPDLRAHRSGTTEGAAEPPLQKLLDFMPPFTAPRVSFVAMTAPENP